MKKALTSLARIVTVIVGVAMTTGGCTPHIGTKLDLPAVQAPTADRVASVAGPAVRTQVDRFFDARASDILAEVEGRQVPGVNGDVGVIVAGAFREALQTAGVVISPTAGNVITGEVVRWKAVVVPGFPTSKVDAIAEIKIKARSQRGGRIYSATYKGGESGENPTLTDDEVRGFLGRAMTHALVEAVNDSSLIGALASN